jgi:hypothetical protein
VASDLKYESNRLSEQMQHQVGEAQDRTVRSMRTWNDLVRTTTDMAFDVVLKNWNYSRSLRGSAEQAVEDAIRTQHQYTNEMLQVWQGYTDSVQQIVSNAPTLPDSQSNGKK